MKKLLLPDLKSLRNDIQYLLYNFGISILLVLLIEIMARHSIGKGLAFVWNHPFLVLFSAFVLTGFYSLALLFPKRNFVWLCVTSIILLLGITNCILLFFRITPLAATDITLITSVFEIMLVYLSWVQIVFIILAFLILIVFLTFTGIKMKKQSYSFGSGILIFVLMVTMTILITKAGDDLSILQTEFSNLPDAYSDNGFVYCFMRSLFDRGIKKPEEYSEEIVDDILSSIKIQETKEVERKPNIIFLQIESFIDLNKLKNVTYSENPIPVFDSLEKSCQTGFLTVPSVGAGTANTEFEVLTGMNLDYFGAGEYPYKTVLQNTTCESMAYNLKELGYKSTAIHNNTATFYDRNKVFSNLGFDYYISLEYMKDLVFNDLRWAKDNVLTLQILEALKNTEEPDFVYAITVQDHGKYPVEPMKNPHITAAGFADDDPERHNSFQYYVNQVHETDQFIGYLISTMSSFKEPVIIVMYGDHMPNFDITEEELTEGNPYQTEYIIWTNKAMNATGKLNGGKKDLYAYQLSAYLMNELGMNNGLLTKFHQTYSEITNYKTELKTLQYDMLYGNQEVYDGNCPYVPTEIKMGVLPITISDVAGIGGSTYVMGVNFTQSSIIYINDKKIDTTYLGPSTLIAVDKSIERGDRVYVSQNTDVGVKLSQTDTFIYEK